MKNLVFGVVDTPYSSVAKNGKTRTETTGEVANILEKKYHVMETYFELHKRDIADALRSAFVNSMRQARKRGTMPENPFFDALAKIDSGFRDFLDAGEMQRVLNTLTQSELDYFLSSTSGFTKAAQRGVNHRKKNPYAKKAARPAFIDTGLYQQSFKSWIE